MNKKKTIINVSIYLALLAIVVCVFIFYTNSQSNLNKTTCYIATQDLKAGTVVDTNVVTSSFKQETIHASSKELAEEYNSNVITEASTIINKQTIGFIPKGTVLTNRMFQNINDVVEYPDFDNAQYITLPVTTESMPAEGFVKDSKISIIGMLSMADLSSTELADKTTETWVGVLTNKALVYSTILDESKTVTNVILVVEKDVYPTLLISSSTAKLFYLKGEINDISEVQSDVIKTIYESTGLTTINQKFKLIAHDNTQNKVEYNLLATEKEDEELSKLNILKLDEGKALNVAWNGNPVRAFIKHLNLDDGKKGKFYGSYSYASTDSAKKINYNPNLEEHSFAVEFDEEGYYEIDFYNQQNEFVSKTVFVIEQQEYSWKSKNSNVATDSNGKVNAGDIKVSMIQKNENNIDYIVPEYAVKEESEYEITCKLIKDYFANVEPLKDYAETIQFEGTIGDDKKNIYTTDYVISKDDEIGYFLGDTIKEAYIVFKSENTYDENGNPSEIKIPLFWVIDKVGVDYSITNEQVQQFRELLNSNVNLTELKKKYSYSEMKQLLELINEYEGLLRVTDEVGLTSGYLPLSYFLRFLITGEDMKKAEFEDLIGQLYDTTTEIPTKKEGCALQIEIVLDNSKEVYRLNLDFILQTEPSEDVVTPDVDTKPVIPPINDNPENSGQIDKPNDIEKE